jgi:hypothetical protein
LDQFWSNFGVHFGVILGSILRSPGHLGARKHQESPREPQETPRQAQERSKTAQDRPKTGQESPRDPKNLKKPLVFLGFWDPRLPKSGPGPKTGIPKILKNHWFFKVFGTPGFPREIQAPKRHKTGIPKTLKFHWFF